MRVLIELLIFRHICSDKTEIKGKCINITSDGGELRTN